jgi:tetratricopeptide (TPR) repeat protein
MGEKTSFCGERARSFARAAFLCGIVLPLALGAAAQEPEPGRLVPSVTCRTDPKNSFSIYLPKGYTSEKKWPLLLCFAPDGRAEVPVGLLKDAAEEFGFIAAGSRNSLNGPWPPVIKAYDVLWKELNARFPLDPGRCAGVGFSGGARAALYFALDHPERFFGVLSCGAFGTGTREVPKDCRLSLVLCAGREDFNYYEMARADRKLEGRTRDHLLIEWDGEHRWPPAPILRDGVALLVAGAMKAGSWPKDEAFLSALARSVMAQAKKLEEAGRALQAQRLYRGIAALVPGVAEAGEAPSCASALEASAGLRSERDLEVRYEDLEEQLRGISDPNRYTAFLAKFQSKRDSGGPEGEHAARLCAIASSQLLQKGLELLQKGYLKEAAFCLETATALTPGRPLPAYNAACAYARMGKTAEAVTYLRKAVENGFRDAGQLRRDTDLDKVRKDPAFQEILARLELKP